jgi:predicted transposase YbfD/YdcC
MRFGPQQHYNTYAHTVSIRFTADPGLLQSRNWKKRDNRSKVELTKTDLQTESLKMKHNTQTTLDGVLREGKLLSVDSLIAALHQISDPRKARGVRYPLVELLVLLILAKLGGEDNLKGMAEWVRLRGECLKRLLKLERNSLPHQTTYERVLDRLDSHQVEQVIGQFFRQPSPANLTVTLDGKVLRGTIAEGETQGVHLLAAYTPERGVVLLQVEVARQANEITAAAHLLEALDLSGCIVTGDAIFTQVSLCEQIVQAGGDYVLPVKANQAELRQAIADLFMPPAVSAGHNVIPLPIQEAETLSAGHGRLEYRYLTVSSQLNDYLTWPFAAQVFRLQRVRQSKTRGKLSYEVVFGVTSLNAEDYPPQRLMQIIREHWHIENRLHYVRDVTFHEDACKIRQPKRQRLLACLNNLAIGLIHRTSFDFVPDARRFFSLYPDAAFQLLLE